MTSLLKTLGFLTAFTISCLIPSTSNAIRFVEGVSKIPDNWKQTHVNQTFNSDVITSINVAYQPISNQQVINMFYFVGREKNSDDPWKYMVNQSWILEPMTLNRQGRYNPWAKGKDGFYLTIGKEILPEEIRERYGVTPIPNK